MKRVLSLVCAVLCVMAVIGWAALPPPRDRLLTAALVAVNAAGVVLNWIWWRRDVRGE